MPTNFPRQIHENCQFSINHKIHTLYNKGTHIFRCEHHGKISLALDAKSPSNTARLRSSLSRIYIHRQIEFSLSLPGIPFCHSLFPLDPLCRRNRHFQPGQTPPVAVTQFILSNVTTVYAIFACYNDPYDYDVIPPALFFCARLLNANLISLNCARAHITKGLLIIVV